MTPAALDTTLHDSFELVKRERIDSLMLDVVVSQHKKTGAMHYHLAHQSDENAFVVGFRTQPMDSCGAAHILEHTALCGSVKYPVRDPFFSMIKRSLQTFMNAFTASDWTAYPFATQNPQDFDNLLSVYLDAAFFPTLNPLDFAQEGIRLVLGEDGKPEFKGIVFNEMKGAMSGEVDQLYHAVASHLYRETTYHHNSGGDPTCIPDLSYDDLKSFHEAHYHPSNAVFMTFGNKSLLDLQAQFDDKVLVHFSAGRKFSSVPEPRLAAPVQVTDSYAVDAITEKQTHHVLAWLLPEMTDPKIRLALRLVEGILIEHAGSPLRKLLESSDLGTAPSSLFGLDDNHFEMTFYAGLRGSEAEHAEAMQAAILGTLTELASKPVSQDEIDMVLHQMELNQRHIGGDGMPYGLSLLLDGLTVAIHDGDAVDVWQVEPHIQWLREQLTDENWLPSLIKTHFLDNPHRMLLTLSPDDKKTEKLQAAEQKRLDDIDATLTDEKRAEIKQLTEDLAARQAEADDISVLPKVGLEDVPATLELAEGRVEQIELAGKSAELHRYAAGTNGLFYIQFIVPLTHEILENPLLGTYMSLLGELGAGELSADEFQAEQAQHSGGISVKVSQRTALKSRDEFDAYLVFSTRALVRKTEAFELLKACWFDTNFDEANAERAMELLQQKQARWQSRLAGSGHAYALQTSSSSYSPLASINYSNEGLPALKRLKAAIAEYEDAANLHALMNDMTALHAQLHRLPMQVLLVAEEAELDGLVSAMQGAWQDVTAISNKANDAVETHIDPASTDTAWLIQTNVYHHAMSYKAVPVQHDDTPTLMILGPYLRNNYLHRAIREQGGAYGGGASYDASSCSFRFYSYRDPRLAETYADFVASVDWLLTESQDDIWLEEAILNVIAGVDKPGSPAGEAVKVCFAELHGRTREWQQTLRAKLLKVTLADLQRVAKTYLQDQPAIRASVAPYDKADELEEMGFAVEKMPS